MNFYVPYGLPFSDAPLESPTPIPLIPLRVNTYNSIFQIPESS